jgi:hypothetical protein
VTSYSKFVIAAATVALAACMHNNTVATPAVSAAGDLAVDSLSATRTAIIRVQNDYNSEVRVFTVLDGKANYTNYVAKALPGEVRTRTLDPNLIPAHNISFEVQSKDGTMKYTVGPFDLQRNETLDLVVPAGFQRVTATVHRSTP